MKKLVALVMVLALLALLAPPIGADVVEHGQEVTGETDRVYVIVSNVNFGKIAPNSTKTINDVITATYNATLAFSVASTTEHYVAGRLVKLEYLRNGSTVITITAPTESGKEKVYTVYPAELQMSAGESLAMRATTGLVPGVWDPVVITIRVAT